MTRLSWDASGERFYETGVDRGVLYAPSSTGVAWTGLISVSESPTGGEARPYYIEGYKYLNLSSAEEYAASISAYNSPPEFGPCDGTVSIQNGLFVTQQPRKSFGFSYRTRIGNDIDGPDHAYKIHLVYNALSSPPQRSNSSIDDSTKPLEIEWNITTMAPAITGYRPTAHFVIDSRFTAPFTLKSIEDFLYGSDSLAARLPQPTELIEFFEVPSVKAVLVSANTYEIHQVDPANARAVMQAFPPVNPTIGEDPIIWFDTSNSNYVVAKILTGS